MFEITITSLHEFHMFVKIIRGKDLDDAEITRLSQSLGNSADKLIAAEEAQKTKEG